MTQADAGPVGPHPEAGAPGPVPLTRRIDPSAFGALFAVTLARLLRARRVAVLVLLYLLPIVFAGLIRYHAEEPFRPYAEAAAHALRVLIYFMIPHALIPLTALVYSTGLIQDEVEEQTLTYLLMRPLPRPAIYLAKLLAAWVAATILAVGFSAATYFAVAARVPVLMETATASTLRLSVLFALSLGAYCGVFGLLGLFLRRALVVGIAYILLFEGVLASIPFAFRKLTIIYYFRVLVLRWQPWPTDQMERDIGDAWAIDLLDAPEIAGAAWTLALIGLVSTALAAFLFSVREFRLKTPETN